MPGETNFDKSFHKNYNGTMNTDYILVTGGAGFIGYHVCVKLLTSGYRVVVVDSLNDYYSVKLKRDRVNYLKKLGAEFKWFPLETPTILDGVMSRYKPRVVIHLAAQAGVRYSEQNPMAYTMANLVGFQEVVDSCRKHQPERLLYASSSSVYGNVTGPANEDLPVNPLSYYAVTKVTNEMTAGLFGTQTGIPTTGMRFFTAYGPWGRPDMAYWHFSEKILNGSPLTIYGQNVARDFTYVGDVADSVVNLMNCGSTGNKIINIGSNNPISVVELVNTLQSHYGKKAIIQTDELPSCDPQVTYCDSSKLLALTGKVPNTSFHDGIQKFAEWFQAHSEIYK